MQTNKIHWSSLLTLVVLGLGASFLILLAFGMGIASVVNLFTEEGDAAGQMISAFTFGFEGLALLACGWFVLQKTMGHTQADARIQFPFAGWQVVGVIGLAGMSIAVGAVIVFTKVVWLAWLTLPVLTLLVIVPPIWLLFGVGSNGIELGPRWRVFGIFGLGMTLSPLVMVVIEVVLLAVGIVLGAVFIAVWHPDIVQELDSLRLILQHETDEDVILKLVAPYISSPAVIAALLGYIAVLVPLVEELFKPLAVWLFARKLDSPTQGFAMGLLSGAAFALVESLNASGSGTETWPLIVSVRAGTSMLHVMASGLVGWGIVSAFRERRIWRLFAAYFSAVLIHGIWNACAVGVGFSFVGELIGKPEWLFTILPAALGGMFALAAGMLSMLVVANKRIRKSSATTPLPVTVETSNGSGEAIGTQLEAKGEARDEGVQ